MVKKPKTKAEEPAQEKEEATKEPVKKEPAKKRAVKKEPEKKTEEIYLQFGAEEWNMAELKEKAVAAYVAEGHRASGIKHLAVYVKPEERKAYFVVNEKAKGDIDL